MTFEVLTAVKMWIMVLWVMTPCSLVDGYQRFGESCRFHLQVEKNVACAKSN
jgi:hypothetical protein